MRRLVGFIFFVGFTLALAVPAKAERRVALVIGNGGYSNAPLKNPVNDARDMASVLRELGFEVILRQDASLRQMEDALDIFWRALRKGGTGLFFFAGHGLQVKGVNYLVPVDAHINVEQDVKSLCLDANRVLGRMENAGNGLNIVILDACRNNPFSRSWRTVDQGLAKMDAPTGTLIAYATAPDSVASDGAERNGVYTQHLLQQMRRPGVKIEDVLKQVRIAVLKNTERKQIPWESSSLTGDFYFKPVGVNMAAPLHSEQPSSSPQLVMTQLPSVASSSALPSSLGPYKPDQSDSPNPGTTLKDSVSGMEFVWIPGGCFQMGSIPSEMGRYADESPTHEVCVSGFWLGKYAVTNADYQKFRPSHNSGSVGGILGLGGKTLNGAKQPVVNVSWKDAKSYALWMSRTANGNFRLPTEAEWEYAARAGTTTSRYWGDNPDDACAYANVYDQSSMQMKEQMWEAHACDDGFAVSALVGSFHPNQFGLYDMLGNVSQWCEDVFTSYSNMSMRDNPRNVDGGNFRVNRGGGWRDEPRYVRSAHRYGNSTGYVGDDLGFRLVRVP